MLLPFWGVGADDFEVVMAGNLALGSAEEDDKMAFEETGDSDVVVLFFAGWSWKKDVREGIVSSPLFTRYTYI